MTRSTVYQTRAQRIAAKRDLLIEAALEYGCVHLFAPSSPAELSAALKLRELSVQLYEAWHEPAQQRTKKGAGHVKA